MPDAKLHSEYKGKKPGETVTLSAAELAWATSEGYVSTATSDGNDVAGQPIVDYTTATDQTIRTNRANPNAAHVTRVLSEGKATGDSTQTPEAFDPDKRTVAEVTAYLAQLTDDAGGRAEKARVKAVEARGQKRAGIASA